MYIRKKHNKNIFTIFFSFCIILGFSYLMLVADKYETKSQLHSVNASFLSLENTGKGNYLPLNNIVIEEKGSKFTYIVQPNDTLSHLAFKFGTTVETIKEVNDLQSDGIRPLQKLTITQTEGVLYELEKDYTAKQFAQEYDINLKKLKSVNYMLEGNKRLNKGDEIFIPIKKQIAKKKGLISEEDETSRYVRRTNESSNMQTSNVIYKRWYQPNISNGFYRGHCTRYVAIQKFPYEESHKQNKLWNGNAKNWYYNAKKAGYKVGQTPKKDSIVVIKYGGRYYSWAGHVGIVKKIDWQNEKILIKEMNAKGKFIVTKRWIPMNSDIIGYVYESCGSSGCVK